MIHQTKLTDVLNPNKFKTCKLKPWAAPNKSYLSIPFLWDTLYLVVYANVIYLTDIFIIVNANQGLSSFLAPLKVCESLFCLKISVTATSKEIIFSQIAHFELIRNSPFTSG